MVTPDKLAALLLKNHVEKKFAYINDLYTDEVGCSFLTGMSLRTLRRLRYADEGPPAFKSGRWLYDLGELAEWLNSRPRHTHSDQK